jgi:hypothetical protein
MPSSVRQPPEVWNRRVYACNSLQAGWFHESQVCFVSVWVLLGVRIEGMRKPANLWAVSVCGTILWLFYKPLGR